MPSLIPRAKKVMVIAGEVSGDFHTARFIRELNNHNLQFYGIGGQEMRACGVDILVDIEKMAVMGIVEVLKNYRYLHSILTKMRLLLKNSPPDLLVLVDYPGFNLRLAETAQQLNIPVLYYISPQIWAWRPKRIKKIAKLVNHMCVIFPFEKTLYEQAGVPVSFVGHPLAGNVIPQLSKEEAFQKFNLKQQHKVIGIFPGSRKSEIQRLLPIFLSAATLIHQQMPNTQFILPLASTLQLQDIQHESLQQLPVTIIKDQLYDVIQVCDTIMTASGTVTLEIASLQVPMVVSYKVAPISYAILSRLINIEHISLCNIVAQKKVIEELIQQDATPTNICSHIINILIDTKLDRRLRRELEEISKKLSADEVESLPQVVLDMLGL
jgi:lipid-A-disaccharide synthase